MPEDDIGFLRNPLIKKTLEEHTQYPATVKTYQLLAFGLRKDFHLPHLFHTEGTWVDCYRINSGGVKVYSDKPDTLTLDFSIDKQVVVQKDTRESMIVTALCPSDKKYTKVSEDKGDRLSSSEVTALAQNHPDLMIFMDNGYMLSCFLDDKQEIIKVEPYRYIDSPVIF